MRIHPTLRDACIGGDDRQVLPTGEVAIEGGRFHQRADLRQAGWISRPVLGHHRRAGGGTDQAQQHPQVLALPAPFRPRKPYTSLS
ncbi:MAG: hypothetical protein DLM66_09320 [Candidatus Dormiibacter spiritus]|nr:MAG: hypothetical protein DLM66_09320 [Candidatus Dormibacteraeota bacterium]